MFVVMRQLQDELTCFCGYKAVKLAICWKHLGVRINLPVDVDRRETVCGDELADSEAKDELTDVPPDQSSEIKAED